MILLIFHHLAQHKSKLTTPSDRKLINTKLLDRCLIMVDAVYWQGEMYDCEANQNVITKITDVMRWGVSIEQIKQLKDIVGK